jgi:excisionase family DNA binding protein
VASDNQPSADSVEALAAHPAAGRPNSLAAAVVPLLLTPREAARALAIGERTLWSLTRRGEIPVVRIGRAVRYDPRDLDVYVQAQKQTAQRNGCG